MSKHTKGPWRYTVSEGSNYCRIYCHNSPHWGDNLRGYCGEANARLISAAPDLLEALETLRDEIIDTTWDNSFRSALDKATAAIFKAKGEV